VALSARSPSKLSGSVVPSPDSQVVILQEK
jgi:hypothetical protein